MLFQSAKAKDKAKFQKVATKDAKEFKKSMRNPTTDVYAYLVNFVGQKGTEEAIISLLPLQYAEFADVGLEDNAKVLPKHSKHNLTILLTLEGVLPY